MFRWLAWLLEADMTTEAPTLTVDQVDNHLAHWVQKARTATTPIDQARARAQINKWLDARYAMTTTAELETWLQR